jgi:predicted HicB family RNase H-like nuclease
MRQMNIRISDATYLKLKEQSKSNRISMNRLIDHFVSEGVKMDQKPLIKQVLSHD